MNACLRLSHLPDLKCQGQNSKQEHASVVQALWRDVIQLELILKGNFYLSKQNPVASLRSLLIAGPSNEKWAAHD